MKAAVCRALSRVLRQRDEGFEVVKSSLIYSASLERKADGLFFVDKAIRDEEARVIEYESWLFLQITKKTINWLLRMVPEELNL